MIKKNKINSLHQSFMEIFETPLPGLGTKVTFKGQSGEFL
jgi:hypothetical protein